MSKYILFLLCLAGLSFSQSTYAQGPPITGDKPIMLSGKTMLLKTRTEIQSNKAGTLVYAPLMMHYLPTSNSLIGIHIPYLNYNLKNSFGEELTGSRLGDIELLGKYQFYRKDKTGKTFRIVAKTVQTIPTGKEFETGGFHTGLYQGYFGSVAGLESIKYGISNELGYNFIPGNNLDDLRYKLGFGLPLLKPVYPVNQLNLYFEYQTKWFTEIEELELLYAQGIQYARGHFTWEVSIQFPLYQTALRIVEKNYSLYLGTRYVF